MSPSERSDLPPACQILINLASSFPARFDVPKIRAEQNVRRTNGSSGQEALSLISDFSARHNLAVSRIMERAGLSRALITYWRNGVTPSKNTMKILRMTLAELEQDLASVTPPTD
jgi:hypothetical protein